VRKWGSMFLLAGIALFLQVGVAQIQPPAATLVVKLDLKTMSAPVILHGPDTVYTVEARRAKFQGACVVSLIVDSEGSPQDIHVVRALGMGLDEKAIEAVKHYKFKPAMMKDSSVPVAVRTTIEINFHLN